MTLIARERHAESRQNLGCSERKGKMLRYGINGGGTVKEKKRGAVMRLERRMRTRAK